MYERVVTRHGDVLLVTNAVCCRTWPVFIGVTIRRCKLCGTRPEVQR